MRFFYYTKKKSGATFFTQFLWTRLLYFTSTSVVDTATTTDVDKEHH